MTADEVLAGMALAYASCRTYRDTGRVSVRTIPTDRRPYTTITPFSTAFVRPGKFRFEYTKRIGDGDGDFDRFIVWAGGSDVRTWWDVVGQVERPESLGLAVAGATGVSEGAAHTVPALLMPGVIGGRCLTTLVGVIHLGDQDLGGVVCHRLQGDFPLRPESEAALHREEVIRVTGRVPERATHSPLTLWIDRDSFLLYRLEERVQFESFAAETVTTYQPLLDGTVGEDDLRFDPPT